jgi:raffinose/stachyose/melibiose transport system permease protein
MAASNVQEAAGTARGFAARPPRRRSKQDLAGYLFILPVVVFFCAFFIYPLFYSIRLSLFEWTGYTPDMLFVGLRNFVDVVHNWVFWTAVKNTFLFALVLTLVQTSIALVLAIILDTHLVGREVFKVIFFTPVLVSIAVVSLLWGRIFEPNFGLLNGILDRLGLGFLQHAWLGDASVALYCVVGVSAWSAFGYSMVLFLAGLQDINEDLKEAARIDGATDMGVIRHITVPLMRPVIALVSTLTLIGGLKVFEIIYVMTNGGPNHATESVSSLLYYEAFRFNRMGIASAIAVFLLIGTMGMSILQRRLMESEAQA